MLDVTAVLDVRNLPACKAMINEFQGRALTNRIRRALYAGAKVFGVAITAEAQQHHGGASNVPASFAKVGAPKVSTHGGAGRGIEAYVRPKSPLFNVFEVGAGQHEIDPGAGPLAGYGGGLGFWTPGSRKRSTSFFSTKPVRHPGMKARPILPAAFASRLDVAEHTVAAALFGNPSAGGGIL